MFVRVCEGREKEREIEQERDLVNDSLDQWLSTRARPCKLVKLASVMFTALISSPTCGSIWTGNFLFDPTLQQSKLQSKLTT